MEGFQAVKQALLSNVVAPIVWLLFAVALIWFLWGVGLYIWKADAPDERAKGQRHMIVGAIGMAIMISAFGITQFIFNTLNDDGNATGIDGQKVPRPSVIDRGFQ
jgi:hypothetical protein